MGAPLGPEHDVRGRARRAGVLSAERGLDGRRALIVLAVYIVAQNAGAFVASLIGTFAWGLAGADLSDASTFHDVQQTVAPVALVVGFLTAGAAIALVTLRFARGAIRERSTDGIAWARGEPADLAVGLAAGALLASGSLLIATFAIPPEPEAPVGPLTQMASTPGIAQACWVLLAIGVPPIEEFLFRGVLYSGLARSWGRSVSAVAVTVGFVLLHVTETLYYWPANLGIAAFAVVALALRIRGRAVGPAVATHFAYNAVLVAYVLGTS